MSTRQRHFALFASILSISLVWFYFPFLFNKLAFYRMDSTYYFEPFITYIRSALAHGRMPMWNSLSFCGMPQIAVSSPGLFYPPHLLFLLFSFSQALALIQLCQQLIIGIGAYLLIADLGWGAVPAAVAGTTLAGCGFMFTLASNYTLPATASWLPLAIWSLRRITPSCLPSNWSNIALASLCVFMLITAGRPEIWLPALAMAGGYFIYAAVARQRSKKPAAASAADLEHKAEESRLTQQALRFASVACGCLLAMPALLPALEWIPLSPRAHGLPLFEVLKWSANWYDCLGLILAQPFGDLSIYPSKLGSLILSTAESFPFMPSAYAGAVAFTLALWAAADRSFKCRWLFLFAFLFFLCLAMGGNTPAGALLFERFPGLALFRYPVKLLIFPVAILSVMAARGAWLSFRKPPEVVAEVGTLTFWGVVLLLSWLLFCWRITGLYQFVRASNADPALLAEAYRAIGSSGLAAATAGLTTCLTARLYWSGLIKKGIWQSLIIGGSALLLFSNAYKCRQVAPVDFFERTSRLRLDLERLFAPAVLDSKQRLLPLIFDPITRPASFPGSEGLSSTGWFFQYGRQVLMPNCHMEAHVPLSSGYESACTGNYQKLYMSVIAALAQTVRNQDNELKPFDLPLARFCKLTATKYVETPAVVSSGGKVVLLRPLDQKRFELIGQYIDMNVRIYKVKDSLARAYFAGAWQKAGSSEDFVDSVLERSEAGFNPSFRTYVEYEPHDPIERIERVRQNAPLTRQPGDLAGERRLSRPIEAAAGKSIEYKDISEEHVLLAVKTSFARLLVLSDTFYPGWQASIDGQPAKIYRTNLIARGVLVPSGAHLVEFTYRPLSLYCGAVLSLCALAFLIGLYFLMVLREKIACGKR